MNVQIEESWKTRFAREFEETYFKELTDFVRGEYSKTTVYPPPKYIFRAFNECPFGNVKVVILGQDPYHGQRQANGLCFSVNEGTVLPPSLRNIFIEIESDLKHEIKKEGNLLRWAKQGVLLLNATLTVRARSPGSHQGRGWERFTDAVVRAILIKEPPLVFMLWGNYAKEKGRMIDRKKFLVLEAAHPSPFSASNGFFDCKHFSKANKYLEAHGVSPIEW